jgi:RNA polymerase sigma factor (sigma-70 family)
MKNQDAPTTSDFDLLLAWLDSDREAAGRKYEKIRQRLIRIFAARGCPDAEDLADETINRVTFKAPQITSSYEGDPAYYFYGVAKHIYQEAQRRRPPAVPPVIDRPGEEVEAEYGCLEECLQRRLTPESRELVIDYYQGEKRDKIEHRKQLAARLGITQTTLRIRAHRIRAQLSECVHDCLERSPVM